jgi:5-oxoprolinase (ATP-hydrolysing) subunit A
MIASIDLNADLGEGSGEDAAIMPWITSANIACGAHAGDDATMRAALALAQTFGVAAGAHPGYPDRAGFGRRELDLPPAEVARSIIAQLGALARWGRFGHVKPHGALYNRSARDPAVAAAVAAAVLEFDPNLMLVGLAGGALVAAGRSLGLRVREEAFADRAYLAPSQLVSRDQPGAVLATTAAVVAQAMSLAREGGVRTRDGTWVTLRADTLCLHGDGADAATRVRAVHEGLQAAGVRLTAGGDDACLNPTRHLHRAATPLRVTRSSSPQLPSHHA